MAADLLGADYPPPPSHQPQLPVIIGLLDASLMSCVASLQQHLRLTTPYLIVTWRLSVRGRYPADRLGAGLGVAAGRVRTAALQLFVDGGSPRRALLLHQLRDDRLHRFCSLMNNTRITSTGCLTEAFSVYVSAANALLLIGKGWSV